MPPVRRNPIWPDDWPGPKFPDRPTLVDLLDRASYNPELLRRLAEDPLGTCQEWGVGANSHAVKIWLGFDPDRISDEELLQVLKDRLQGKRCSA